MVSFIKNNRIFFIILLILIVLIVSYFYILKMAASSFNPKPKLLHTINYDDTTIEVVKYDGFAYTRGNTFHLIIKSPFVKDTLYFPEELYKGIEDRNGHIYILLDTNKTNNSAFKNKTLEYDNISYKYVK